MDNTKAFIDDCEKNHDDSGAITMVDVLEEEQELEDDANAVLGASDDQNCTYPQGYVKRQALYACFSCTEESGASAGICLACSYACHEGHKLFELYTKRYTSVIMLIFIIRSKKLTWLLLFQRFPL